MSIDVTIQFVEACPHWATTYSLVAGLLDEANIPAVLKTQLIGSSEEASEFEFRGSPTVLIDGTDPFFDPHMPVALACRLYLSPDGSSGVPPSQQLKEALSVR